MIPNLLDNLEFKKINYIKKLLDHNLINVKIKIRCILLVVNYLKAKEAKMNSSLKSISYTRFLIKKAKASPLLWIKQNGQTKSITCKSFIHRCIPR